MRDEDPEITADLLLRAYISGIFPMAETRDDTEIFWVDPRRRGIFPIGGFHASRSLRRRIRSEVFSATTDRAFPAVVSACADRDETWINPQIEELYSQLHAMGHAHSLEVWEDTRLVGGVYGVAIGAAFFGESMFSYRTDASKIALAYLTDRLQRTGFRLFDTQFLTPHLKSLGAVEVSRTEYHGLLRSALARPADFTADGAPPSGAELLRRLTA
ncbi:MAG: leucyl/phenylalanyl-tRNA--protein transferase [Pseudomonadota bacterium]